MGTQFTIDELANSLVSPAYFSEEEEDMDVDILSVSAQGTERHSDDSDIEVIACYRHVPIAPTKQNATRKMTTDLSSCVDDGLPEFPWDDFSDFWPEDFKKAIVELGTGPGAIGRTIVQSTSAQNLSLRRTRRFPHLRASKGPAMVVMITLDPM